MLTGRAEVDYASELQPLAGTPWSTRLARGPDGRAALEVYRGAAIIDVVVAHSLAPELLRGARRVGRHGLSYCIAWGCLPGDGDRVRAEFRPGRLRLGGRGARRQLSAPVMEIAGVFWIATATGPFDRVTATSLDRHQQRGVTPLRF